MHFLSAECSSIRSLPNWLSQKHILSLRTVYHCTHYTFFSSSFDFGAAHSAVSRETICINEKGLEGTLYYSAHTHTHTPLYTCVFKPVHLSDTQLLHCMQFHLVNHNYLLCAPLYVHLLCTYLTLWTAFKVPRWLNVICVGFVL